jgi:hypothetical protein
MILVCVQKHDQWLSRQTGMPEVICTHSCKTAVFETIYKFTAVQNLHKTDSVAGVRFCYRFCDAVLKIGYVYQSTEYELLCISSNILQLHYMCWSYVDHNQVY